MIGRSHGLRRRAMRPRCGRCPAASPRRSLPRPRRSPVHARARELRHRPPAPVRRSGSSSSSSSSLIFLQTRRLVRLEITWHRDLRSRIASRSRRCSSRTTSPLRPEPSRVSSSSSSASGSSPSGRGSKSYSSSSITSSSTCPSPGAKVRGDGRARQLRA